MITGIGMPTSHKRIPRMFSTSLFRMMLFFNATAVAWFHASRQKTTGSAKVADPRLVMLAF